MKRVEIVCHKGANEYAPENTYAAAQRCIDWGSDYVEIDVNLSKDGEHYILHGPSVELTTDGTGEITDLTAAEIDRLDAGGWFHSRYAGERVPRLAPFLRWIKGKAKVFLDVKSGDLPAIVELVNTLGLEEECFFWFGNDADAQAFRGLTKTLALKVNVRNAAEVAHAHEAYGANLVEVRLKDLTEEVIAECRRRGLRIMVYHPWKEPEAFRRILRLGVDLVNVDHGDVFLRVADEYYAMASAGAAAGAGSPAQVKRVVLFLLDGCRPDGLEAASTPTIDRLRSEGAWTMAGRSVMPSITLPCHTSLFFSCAPERHGVLENNWTPKPALGPSLIDVIRKAGYDTAAYYTWEPLRDLAAPGSLVTSFFRTYRDEEFGEFGRITAASIAQAQPSFAFVYLEAPDACGHRYGWMSPRYLHAIARADDVVERVLQGLDEAGDLESTAVIVMADHGGHERGHGTDCAEDMTVPVIVWGPGIRKGHELSIPAQLMDVAPTILRLLGLEYPQGWEGTAIDEVFAE